MLHDVHRKSRMLAAGDPSVTFGLADLLPATHDEVLGALADLAGWDLVGEGEPRGKSYVDPAQVARQAEAAADRLARACRDGETVLFGTGHPVGPLEMYGRLARAMRDAGARIVRVGDGESFEGYVGGSHISYVSDVACVAMGGDLVHTHSPRPMQFLLTLEVPALVVGDHGFTGAGLAAGCDAVALVDTNDPALALAHARGLPINPLLCDDARPSHAYEGLTRFIVTRMT